MTGTKVNEALLTYCWRLTVCRVPGRPAHTCTGARATAIMGGCDHQSNHVVTKVIMSQLMLQRHSASVNNTHDKFVVILCIQHKMTTKYHDDNDTLGHT